MGLNDLIKSQFIEVIEWVDSESDVILFRFPVQGKEIKMNAELIVRESQIAIFVNEGVVADVFTPGRYQLQTQNLPVLTKINSWKYGFNSPFKAEVYFVNTKQFINHKWGTISPILLKDSNFGLIRLRGFGNYAFKVTDSVLFLRELSGTKDIYKTDGVLDYLKGLIVSNLTDVIGELKISILEIPSRYQLIAELTNKKVNEKLLEKGLQLTEISISSITVPEEVEKYIDKQSSMAALGNLDTYTKFQTAEAIKDISNNPGGMVGLGPVVSAGIILGKVFGENAIVSKKEDKVHDGMGNKFCHNCGTILGLEMKFCDQCGEKQEIIFICSKCKTKLKPDSKYCVECGNKISESGS
jgi:membrane protease subunit (stomatin/prohibitin family)